MTAAYAPDKVLPAEVAAKHGGGGAVYGVVLLVSETCSDYATDKDAVTLEFFATADDARAVGQSLLAVEVAEAEYRYTGDSTGCGGGTAAVHTDDVDPSDTITGYRVVRYGFSPVPDVGWSDPGPSRPVKIQVVARDESTGVEMVQTIATLDGDAAGNPCGVSGRTPISGRDASQTC